MNRSKNKSIMNLCLLACFVIFFSHNIHAQTERGTKLLGGNASLRFNEPFSASLSPDLGFFVADKLAIGAAYSISYSRRSDYNNFSTSLSPFARYYFGDGPTRPFAEGMIGYGYFRHRPSEFSTQVPASFGYGTGSLGLGIAHFITSQVGMEAMLNYWGRYNETFHGRLNIRLGFQIYLPSSKNN